jgi:ent-copalyl diphosphate synthase
LNLGKIEEGDPAHMPIGFEIVFPTMLEEAKALGLDLPYESPILQSIHAARAEKLKKVPMEILHNYPTTLVHSLEGLHKDLDWDKLLRLQCANGSFLCSPASTACALAYTKDEKCLDYLNKLLVNFDNAVPNVYPVDLFEHLWMVDRLERLGVSHYFKQEIKDALEYVYRYWTDFGIAWTGNLNVQDIDDTAMGFRLLRLHGFDVSEDCFREFYKDGEFFCMPGQTSQAVTGIFNFYRASQTLFPGETLLEKGRSFAKIFLENKHAKGECYDKWILTKDLDGEVEHALNFPWYASVPRIDHRTYLDHYGTDDIWIGKCLYRMPYVNNKVFLDLAKADFNLCQSIHQKELEEVIRSEPQPLGIH